MSAICFWTTNLPRWPRDFARDLSIAGRRLELNLSSRLPSTAWWRTSGTAICPDSSGGLWNLFLKGRDRDAAVPRFGATVPRIAPAHVDVLVVSEYIGKVIALAARI